MFATLALVTSTCFGQQLPAAVSAPKRPGCVVAGRQPKTWHLRLAPGAGAEVFLRTGSDSPRGREKAEPFAQRLFLPAGASGPAMVEAVADGVQVVGFVAAEEVALSLKAPVVFQGWLLPGPGFGLGWSAVRGDRVTVRVPQTTLDGWEVEPSIRPVEAGVACTQLSLDDVSWELGNADVLTGPLAEPVSLPQRQAVALFETRGGASRGSIVAANGQVDESATVVERVGEWVRVVWRRYGGAAWGWSRESALKADPRAPRAESRVGGSGMVGSGPGGCGNGIDDNELVRFQCKHALPLAVTTAGPSTRRVVGQVLAGTPVEVVLGKELLAPQRWLPMALNSSTLELNSSCDAMFEVRSSDLADCVRTKNDEDEGKEALVTHERRVVLGKVTVEGGLDAAVVTRLVKLYESQVKYCYSLELVKKDGLAGTVTVTTTIDASGTVTDAKVTASTLANAKVEGCITERLLRWRFPKTANGGVARLTLPWTFAPSD